MRGGILPIGTIIPFAGKNTPDKYLFCDGSTFSKDTYPELYAVLESTTLPNLDGRFLEGSSTPRTLKDAGLPNIKASMQYAFFYAATASGAMSIGADGGGAPSGSGNGCRCRVVAFDASKSNSIYGNSTTVQPKTYTVRYLIRAK